MIVRKAFLVLTALVALGAAKPAWASLNTDLNSAAAGGDYASVMTALQLGANPNTRDRAGATPLIWAARSGRNTVAQYLLMHGAAIDAVDKNGDSALMWAARGGHFEVVSMLVAHGANPLIRDWQGQDAIMLTRVSRDWRSENVLDRYLHGETVGVAPRARRPNPVMMAAVAAATPSPVMAVAEPVPVPVPVPVAAAPTAMGEPNPIVKAIALKKLADAGGRAGTMLNNFLHNNALNPAALMDPDVPLGKEVLNLYANVSKTQSLVGCRSDLTKVQTMWNGSSTSMFGQNIKDIDGILKEAGL